ncbi:MAG: hypothetical protein FLDDKLPJ_01906 [Phycisphaerae bacterium]|nr:hypothetical protein [Phycisphaerae bacterium]
MYLETRKRGSKRRIVCLEWDGRMLRVVEAQVGKKGVRLLKVESLLIPAEVDANDATALGKWIRRALDEQGVSAKLAVVDLPRNQAILTTLNLPMAVAGELPGMVEFQISKELPFPLSEAVVDYAVPRDVKSGTAPVLVAAVRNEVVEHLTSVVAAAGLKLERVGLRPFASRTAVMRALGEGMADRVLFVDVGPTMTEIDVLAPDSLPFSRAADVFVPGGLAEPRTFKLGGAAGSETASGFEGVSPLYSLESVTESLVLEVTRSVEAYRARERGQRIGHAVIAGSMGVEGALCEALQQRFDFTVELYNPAATFGWSAEQGEQAAGFASVLGLVLSHDVDPAQHFDFLHPKRTVTQTQVQLRRAPKLVGWAAAVAATAGLVYWSSVSDDLKVKKQLEDSIAELTEDRSEKEQFIKLVKQLQDYDGRQPRWLDEFVQLASLLPDNRDWVLGDVRMDGRERKILLDARFRDEGGKGYQLPFAVADDLESFRRPGATRARYDVDLQVRQRNLTNPKYELKQQVAVYLREDGAAPVVIESRRSREDVNLEAAGPQPRGASSTSKPGAKPDGEPGVLPEPKETGVKSGDAPEKPESSESDEAKGTGVRPLPPGRSSTTGRPPVSTRGTTAPGASSSSGAEKKPVSGVRTDATGKPIAAADSGAGPADEARDPGAGTPTEDKDSVKKSDKGGAEGSGA